MMTAILVQLGLVLMAANDFTAVESASQYYYDNSNYLPWPVSSRNAIMTGLKEGFDRDAKGNPAPEWKSLPWPVHESVVSRINGNPPPFYDDDVDNPIPELKYLSSPDPDSISSRITIHPPPYNGKPQHVPWPVSSRNAIMTGLKEGFDRDAKGNPAPEWKSLPWSVPESIVSRINENPPPFYDDGVENPIPELKYLSSPDPDSVSSRITIHTPPYNGKPQHVPWPAADSASSWGGVINVPLKDDYDRNVLGYPAALWE